MEKSKFVKLNCHDYSDEDVVRVSSVFKKGGLVIFPTETVYGIGADAGSDSACSRIFQAKSRKPDNPLIVHVDSIDTMKKFAHTEEIELLPELEKLWPGPLTVVMRKKDNICNVASAGLHTVGMRIPACDFIREVIHSSGIPIAAPSANISGRPSATRASHILKELGPLNPVHNGNEVTDMGKSFNDSMIVWGFVQLPEAVVKVVGYFHRFI